MRQHLMKRFVAGLTLPAVLLNLLMTPIARPADYPETFDIDHLLETGINGMFDKQCHGYCIVGACAHLAIKVSWKGVEAYTIISPKIEHAVADLVISAYDHVGKEPWKEWRESVGKAMSEINTGPIASLLNTPDGLQGGQSQYAGQGVHQSIRFKEVDIIGHPASLIPQIATLEDEDNDNYLGGSYEEKAYEKDFRAPKIGSVPNQSDAKQADNQDQEGEFNLSAMLDSGLLSVMGSSSGEVKSLVEAFDILEYMERIMEIFDFFTDLLEFYNNAMTILEATTRSTIYANLANPKFRADRLFCPSEIKPFQPYYLSFVDSLYWRVGFPITDGPISGSDHSSTVLNPLSKDILGNEKTTWGHLYPRDGTINNNHDAKVASVAAWRGLDVLLHDVRDGDGGHRMGVSLPDGYWNESGLWEMIYPVKRECSATPYYPDDGKDKDFMEPNEHGGYAWNYYHLYDCCTNTKGKFLLEAPFLMPLCLDIEPPSF